MKTLLIICSATEAATGLALIIIPSIVTQLLLGVAVNGNALTVSRLAGMCLISLGIACWPGQIFNQPLRAMSFYNLLVAFFFIYIGLSSSLVGILLWPVALLHLGFAVVLFRGLLNSKQN